MPGEKEEKSEDEIELKSEEEEGEEEEGEAGAEGDGKEPGSDESPGRRERRRNRYAENVAARATAEAESKHLRERLDRVEREQQQGRYERQRSEPAGDPFEKELSDLHARRIALANRYDATANSGGMTPELMEGFQKDAKVLEDKRIDLGVQQGIARHQKKSAPEKDVDQMRQYLHSRYPAVMSNQRAWGLARAEQMRRRALGEATTNEMIDSCMRYAQNEVFGAPDADPTNADRRRMDGHTSRARAGAAPKTVRMTQALKGIAESWARNMGLSDLPPKEQWRKWAQKTQNG